MSDEQTATVAGNGTDAATPKPAKAKKPKVAKVAKAKAKVAKAKAKSKGTTGPAVLKEYAPDYTKGGKDGKAKTASGNTTIDCADQVADRLRGKPIEDAFQLAAKVVKDEDGNAVTVQALKKAYGHLNVGMQRMNLGNRMRGTLNAK